MCSTECHSNYYLTRKTLCNNYLCVYMLQMKFEPSQVKSKQLTRLRKHIQRIPFEKIHQNELGKVLISG